MSGQIVDQSDSPVGQAGLQNKLRALLNALDALTADELHAATADPAVTPSLMSFRTTPAEQTEELIRSIREAESKDDDFFRKPVAWTPEESKRRQELQKELLEATPTAPQMMALHDLHGERGTDPFADEETDSGKDDRNDSA